MQQKEHAREASEETRVSEDLFAGVLDAFDMFFSGMKPYEKDLSRESKERMKRIKKYQSDVKKAVRKLCT